MCVCLFIEYSADESVGFENATIDAPNVMGRNELCMSANENDSGFASVECEYSESDSNVSEFNLGFGDTHVSSKSVSPAALKIRNKYKKDYSLESLPKALAQRIIARNKEHKHSLKTTAGRLAKVKHNFKKYRAKVKKKFSKYKLLGLFRKRRLRKPPSERSARSDRRAKKHFRDGLEELSQTLTDEQEVEVITAYTHGKPNMAQSLLKTKKFRKLVIRNHNDYIKKHWKDDVLRKVTQYIQHVMNGESRRGMARLRRVINTEKSVYVNVFGYSEHKRATERKAGNATIVQLNTDDENERARKDLAEQQEQIAPLESIEVPNGSRNEKYVKRSAWKGINYTLGILYGSKVGSGHVPFHWKRFKKGDFQPISRIINDTDITLENLVPFDLPDEAKLCVFDDIVINISGLSYDGCVFLKWRLLNKMFQFTDLKTFSTFEDFVNF